MLGYGFLSGLLCQSERPSLEKECDDEHVLRFSFEYFTPVFSTNGRDVVIFEQPKNSAICVCCQPVLSQANCKLITVDKAADILHKQLKRQSSAEQIFENCHVTVYQGKIDKKAKNLISDTHNYGIFAKSWDILELPPIESVGLDYKGSIYSFDYVNKTDEWIELCCLDIFKDKKERIVVTKRTTSRAFSLVNLAAEKISESLSDKEELEVLVKSTNIPAACADSISRCL